MTMVWRWFGVAALVLLTSCGSGSSERALLPAGGAMCQASVVNWASRCAARQGIDVASLQCPETDVALLDLRGTPELRVELRHGPGQGFRRVGSWGLSPVGNFADWNQVAPSMRERFDKVTACVREDEDLASGGSVRSSGRPLPLGAPTAGNSVPWLLLGALACALAALWPVRRSAAWRRRALSGGAMALGTLVLRALLLPEMFFHQNGQGPLWVSTVVSPQYHPYGPGYRALFGWLRWCTREPERGVFLVQGVLGALAVPCAAFVARRLGAPRALAWALALAVAIDPILGRLSRSESYYGVGASLLFLATALLASSMGTLSLRRPGFLLPVIAAGLVIAHHGLVHPVGWLAASLCPAVLLLGPGHWRRRAIRALVAALIVAAVVAVTAGPSMLAVLHSSFGAQWTRGNEGGSRSLERLSHLKSMLSYGLVLAVFMVASARSRLRGVLHVVVMAVALSLLLMADMVGFGATTAWVHQAYLRLYAPVAVVLAAVTLRQVPRSRPQGLALAGAVVLVSLLVSWRAWPSWTKAPTDALEQEVVRRWRRELPSGHVAYLERSDKRVLMLPFYRDAVGLGPSPLILRVGEFAEDITLMGRPYYVHTSLCSTPGGREFCEQFERRYQMTKLHEVMLPAVPSMVGLGYDVPRVRVALYRVDGLSAVDR